MGACNQECLESYEGLASVVLGDVYRIEFRPAIVVAVELMRRCPWFDALGLLQLKLLLLFGFGNQTRVSELCFFKKLITYMETPYGGLRYAAGNPDGFRFGSVSRPSPLRAIYKKK